MTDRTPRTIASRACGLALALALPALLGGCPEQHDAPPPGAPEAAPAAEEPATEKEQETPETAPPTTATDAPETGEGDAPAADAPEEPLDIDTPVARYTPLDDGVLIEADGPLVHAPTGMSFPASAAGFRRLGSRRYDADGSDIGIGYARSWRTALASVTVYFYPRERSRRDGSQESPVTHLEQVNAQIRDRYHELDVIRQVEGTTSLRGIPVDYASSEQQHPGGPEHFGRRCTAFSSVIAAHEWWIKLRATTPVENRTPALAAIEELLAELRLPPTGLPAEKK